MALPLDEYVDKLFKVWDIIDFIKTRNCGGDETKEKIEWFKEVCVEYASDKDNTDAMEFTDWIETILNDEFNILLEEDSGVILATKILKYSDALRKNDEKLASEMAEHAVKTLKERKSDSQSKRQVEGDSDDEDGSTDGSSDEEMEVDEGKEKKERQPKQVTDDDGWTTIQRH
uniref:Pre-rRNA-processing protein TSR2 homolog n=1 Tax=Strongyloides papillosus TaxID=174720 RepID=A0A0N5C5X1_STREA